MSIISETSRDHSRPLQRLSDLCIGESAMVYAINLEGKMQHYVTRFGFVDGVMVSVTRRVPLGNLSVYRIGQAEIALRPETAREIMVVRKSE